MKSAFSRTTLSSRRAAMADVATQPRVSLFELRSLFEDYPTIPLALAMCDQACGTEGKPIKNVCELIRALYQAPNVRDAKTWLQERLPYEHIVLLEVAVSRWLKTN